MNLMHEKPAVKTKRLRGIAWHAGHKKWVAKLHANGRYVTLGYYDDPERAARIYDCASKLLRGPDAVLNFDGLPPVDMTSADIRDLLVIRKVIRAKVCQ